MATNAPITNPAFTKFVSALTATDQLTQVDKTTASRAVRKSASRDRWEISMRGEAAVHHARAAYANLCLARHRSTMSVADAEAAHEEAVKAIWSVARKWFAMPVHTKSDVIERMRFLTRATDGIAGSCQFTAWKAYRERMKSAYA